MKAIIGIMLAAQAVGATDLGNVGDTKPDEVKPVAECSQGTDYSNTQSLTPLEARAHFDVFLPMGGRGACFIDTEDVSRPYAIFELPAMPNTASFLVGSEIQGGSLFSAHVEMLDAGFNPTRRFDANEFRHRGLGYSVLFRPETGESYIRILLDEDRLGNVAVSYVEDPAFVPIETNGVDIKRETMPVTATFSDVGWVFARVYFYEPEADASAE